MRNRFLPAVAILLLGLTPALAQQETAALAERYMKLPALQNMLDSILGPDFVNPMMAAMGGDALPQDKRDQLAKIVSEEVSAVRPQMEKAMIQAAGQTYTVAELEALIKFNSTPEAVSIMGKLKSFNAAYFAGFGTTMQDMQSKIQRRVNSELSAK